jgi:uncharacterized membrane protein
MNSPPGAKLWTGDPVASVSEPAGSGAHASTTTDADGSAHLGRFGVAMSLFNLFHILAGTVAVLAGAVALCVAKGSAPHRLAGWVFGCSMLITAALGGLLGLIKFEQLLITFYAGGLACYLVASGWLTVRPTAAVPGWREACLTVLAVAITLGLLLTGALALRNEAGSAYGFAAEDYFLLAVMAGIGLVGDVKLYRRGGLTGNERLERHLWRMCLGLFIAAGSLFTGPGARAFPAAVRESGLLALPELLIGLTLIFWLVKLRLRSRRAAAPKPLGEP